jgi:hypothetical protein
MAQAQVRFFSSRATCLDVEIDVVDCRLSPISLREHGRGSAHVLTAPHGSRRVQRSLTSPFGRKDIDTDG